MDADVLSLNSQDSTNVAALDADVLSLATLITTNDVYANNVNVSSGDASVTVDYSSVGFASNPAIVGTLRSTNSTDPIIGVQIEGSPTTTGVKFVFSDEIPSDDYSFDILASV